MSKNLVIVESPAKAKTIEKYLGKDYTVRSSYGHVRDLAKGDKAIDIANGFFPSYVISADKKQVISELKKLAKDAKVIWLATDDDREGEAISWHLKETLSLEDKNTRRIVFREITKTAIMNAINSPRTIDIDLVNAQQARRVLDRLVGFELSPILWKKIRGGLSAGRVQSVAVRVVVEREREIEQFEPTSSFRVIATFNLEGGKILEASLPKKVSAAKDAKAFLEKCSQATFAIENLEKKPGKRSPSAPFTTSTLQQEASRKLSFSVSQTMTLAQRLYEKGHITYMRTDSLNLSDDAIKAVKGEIGKAFGNEYSQTRHFKTKSKSAQEAHEAIRPTDFSSHNIPGLERNEARLYDLIWKRAVASQMADAQLEKTTATIGISTTSEKLQAQGEVIKFDGFLKLYIESTDDEDSEEEQKGMLPPLTIGQELDLDLMKATERFTRAAPRYTEASLVKKLEEMGIGRPSTYAPTISTIQKRNYVVKEDRGGKDRSYQELTLKDAKVSEAILTEVTGAEKSKLFPTNTGMVVTDFLMQHFPNIVDYNFTANVEEQFDSIADGKTEWGAMLKDFYGDFHKTVEDTDNHVDRASTSATRLLGKDPKTQRNIYARLGKYGPYVQLGEVEDEDRKFASLLKGQYIESITLEQALELFKLPRELGELDGKPIKANFGRFGPYVLHDGLFASMPKEYDPFSIDLETAIALMKEKQELEANKHIKDFENDPDLKILNGRWGPYISYKKKNYKIPKEVEPAELTYEEAIDLIENAPAKKGRGSKKTTADVKKTTATSSKKTPSASAKKTTAAKAKKTPAKSSSRTKKK